MAGFVNLNPFGSTYAFHVDDQAYALAMDLGALAHLQLVHRVSSLDVLLKRAMLLDMEAIIHLAWIFLQRHHRDEFPDTPDGFKAVGELIDRGGGPFRFLQQIGEAMETRVAASGRQVSSVKH